MQSVKSRHLAAAALFAGLFLVGCGGASDPALATATGNNPGGGGAPQAGTLQFTEFAAQQFPTFPYRLQTGRIPRVTLLRADGNVDGTFNGNVSVTLPDGTTTVVTANGGIANLQGLQVPAQTGSFRLRASVGAASGESNSFEIRPVHTVSGTLIQGGGGSSSIRFVTLTSTDGQNRALANGPFNSGSVYTVTNVPPGSYEVETWGLGCSHETAALTVSDTNTVAVSGPSLTVNPINLNNVQVTSGPDASPPTASRNSDVTFNAVVDRTGGGTGRAVLIGTTSRQLVARRNITFPTNFGGTVNLDGNNPIGPNEFVVLVAQDGTGANSFSAGSVQVQP